MNKLAKDIIAGLEDALAYAKGDKTRGVETTVAISKVNVKAVREKTGLSQAGFSQLFAINVRTLQDWEQQRRNPSVAARIVLALIDQHPTTVKKALLSLGHPLDSMECKGVTETKPKIIKSAKKLIEPTSLKNRLNKKV